MSVPLEIRFSYIVCGVYVGELLHELRIVFLQIGVRILKGLEMPLSDHCFADFDKCVVLLFV